MIGIEDMEPSVCETCNAISDKFSDYEEDINFLTDDIRQINEKLIINACLKCPEYIKYAGKVSEDVILVLVNLIPEIIQYIDDPSVELCKAAALKDVSVLQYITAEDDEFYKYILTKNSKAIQYIENITDEMYEIAIRMDPTNIRFCKSTNVNLQFLAVELDPKTVRLMNRPSLKVYLAALEKDIDALYASVGELKSNPDIFKYATDFRTLTYLLHKYPDVILHLPNSYMTYELVRYAIIIKPSNVNEIPSFIYKMPYEQYILAFKTDPTIYHELPYEVKDTFEIQIRRFMAYIKNRLSTIMEDK